VTDHPQLHVTLPERDIFLRLGGHLTRTRLSAGQEMKYRTLAVRAFELCCPRGRWEIFKVKAVMEKGILLDDGFFVSGSDFAARCAGITHLWCGAVTVGAWVTDQRDRAESTVESTVCDAVGSETADEAMNAMSDFARQQLLRGGMSLDSHRYSPGYGDMSLEIQEFFFDRLRLAELDMRLNERFFMIPEKSVTAFAGIR
jgi:hypothetical protein